MNEAQGNPGKKPLLNDGFVNIDYHRPGQPDREDLRYLDSFQRRGGESLSDDRDPAQNNDSSYPVNIAAHDDSSLRSPNSASRQTHAPASRLRSLPDGQGEVTVKLTPITGRVSRARKGVPVHTCEICRPPKTFTRQEHLRRHQLSHQTPRYRCKFPGCERAFHRGDLLARHVTRHELLSDIEESTRTDIEDDSRKASAFQKDSGPSDTGSFFDSPLYVQRDVPTFFSDPFYHGMIDPSMSLYCEDFEAPHFKRSLSTAELPSDNQDNGHSTHSGRGLGNHADLGFPLHGVLQVMDPSQSEPTRSPIPSILAPKIPITNSPDDLGSHYTDISFSDGISKDIERFQANAQDWAHLSLSGQKELTSLAPRQSNPLDSALNTGSAATASCEEIVHLHSTADEQSDVDSATAAKIIDEPAVIPVHPIDTAELATDSGYGSVQARLDRIKLIHNASVGAKAADNQDITESRTVYSTAPTVRSGLLDLYISEIAEEVAAVLPRSLPKELMAILGIALPHLLEAFAIKIGYSEGEDPVCGHLMYLVHRHKEQIADAVSKVFAFEDEDTYSEVSGTPVIDDMTLTDKISLWQELEDQESPDDDDQERMPWDDGKDATDEFEDYPELRDYRGALIRSTAFAWLQNAMLREIKLEVVGDHDAQSCIRNRILTALGKEVKISRRAAPKTHRLLFQLVWYKDFFTEQEYDIPAHEALPQVLVLTGIHDQAWATSCLEYARTLWPRSGEKIIGLLSQMLYQNAGSSFSCELEGNTYLSAKVDNAASILEVAAVGDAYAISEVGEVLAWFQAALQTSPFDESISSITPTCQITELQPEKLLTTNEPPAKRCTFFSHPPEFEARSRVNCCWTKLFRNPILVRGYPISRHAKAHGGIELDIGTMAELLGTRKVSTVTGKPLLKTATAALIPQIQKNDFIYWHVIDRSDGEYMSYCDRELKSCLDEAPSCLSLADIERSRHIVGWSANAKNVTGGASAKYDIGWSGLKPPSPGCVLEKISIVGGSYITAGLSCVLGKKDKAVHIRSRDDYTMRLKWIAKKYVVLYDVQDRRAWLVDGISALLHLVRASLSHDASDPFKSLLLYDPNSLHEAPKNQYGKIASIQVLTNPHNVGLPLYAKPETSQEEMTFGNADAIRHVTTRTRTYYCFKDRVQGISDILEQIMAHQADESTRDGIGFRLKTSPRRQLEGFDFMDVATDEDPFWPRMTTLRATGRGWVDFTRAIHAVTLFGTGFGELIQPDQTANGSAKACGECLLNSTAPKGQDSLAVCVSELQDILQKRGSKETSPWRLVDEIYWHAPDKTFEACHCSNNPSAKHERMQVLLPSSIPKFRTRGLSTPINLNLVSNGAVLFGHSHRFPLRWKDHGQPEEGPLDIETEDTEISVRDSGLGSSISSASADNTQALPSSRSPLSVSSLNEVGKRDCRQALLSTSAEGVEGCMARAEGDQVEDSSDLQHHEKTPENAEAGTSSSRMLNFMESMSRWKHTAKEK